ncbi:MAG: hypothetical protein AAFR41_03285 [Pseudomonadota bacterium]
MRITLVFLSLAIGAVALSACTAARQDREGPTASEAAVIAVDTTREGLPDAALSPLEDFNLKRDPIPDALKSLSTPYSDAATMSCPEIAAAVDALTPDLGTDWDAPGVEDDKRGNAAGWAAERSSSAALGAVSSSARGFIPFRGLVREATGAEAYASRVRKAFRIGAERRAFLKGVGLAKGCLPPAAPWPDVPDTSPITYRRHGAEN